MPKEQLRVPARISALANQIADDAGRRRPRIEFVVGRCGGWAIPSRNVIHIAAAKRNGRKVDLSAGWPATKSLVVHEMAHLLAPDHHHSREFWRIFWRLVKQYRVDRTIALRRTASYKVAGVIEAAHAGVPGAQELLDAHQRALNAGGPGFIGSNHRCLYVATSIEPPHTYGGQVVLAGPVNHSDRSDACHPGYVRAREDRWKGTWTVRSTCAGVSGPDQPCGSSSLTTAPTEGQARLFAATPQRGDWAH